MVRKLKPVQNDNFFYYCLTEVTYMTLCLKSHTLHTLDVSLQMTILLGQFFLQFSQKLPLVSLNALRNFGITFIMMCFVHILGRCNAHTKATHHRSWQQCYQQEFGFRIRSDSSYILAAEKQHTAILIPWCFQESKNSKIIKAKATKIISAVRFVKTLFTFKSFQRNHSGNNRLLTLFRITYYNDKSSFDLTQFQEKTGSPNFCKVAY